MTSRASARSWSCFAEQYRQDFKEYADRVTFADPGAERQDSVKSGLDSCPDDAALVAIHDAREAARHAR